MSDDSNNDITIYKRTQFWIYKLTTNRWSELLNNFNMEKLLISNSEKCSIKTNDIILIYCCYKNTRLNGVVAICQVSTRMTDNIKHISIFRDSYIDKYYCELHTAFILSSQFKLSNINIIYENSIMKTTSFKSRYLKSYNISNIPFDIGKQITTYIIEYENTLLHVESSENDEDYMEDESEEYSESDDDTEVTLERTGHIPILLEPCDKLIFSENKVDIIDHFKNCKYCNKTDNNNISINNFLDKSNIIFKSINDEDDIDLYLKYYHNSKYYIFNSRETNENDIFIIKIDDEYNMYNNCYLFVY